MGIIIIDGGRGYIEMIKHNDFKNVKIKVPCEEKYIRLARLFVGGIACQMDFPYDMVENIKIAVSEAVQNIIDHAYNKKEKKPYIEIICNPKKETLEIKIIDHGHGFNLEKAFKHPGFGISFMKEFMDQIEYKTNVKNGTTLTLRKTPQIN